MTKKADIIIEKNRSAIQEANELKDEMKGRLMKNETTGSIFSWSPNVSIQKHMRLMTEDEQSAYEKESAKAAKARNK